MTQGEIVRNTKMAAEMIVLSPEVLTLFESLDPSLTTFIVWGKNVEVMVVVKHL